MYLGTVRLLRERQDLLGPGAAQPADHLMLWLVIVWVVFFDLLLPVRRQRRRPPVRAGALDSRGGAARRVRRLRGPPGRADHGAVRRRRRRLRAGQRASRISSPATSCIRGMLGRARRRDTLALHRVARAASTPLAALLFILHQGLHLPIYARHRVPDDHVHGTADDAELLLHAAAAGAGIAYVFAQRTWTVWWVGVCVVTLAALWISYTRSLLVIAVVELVVVLGARAAQGDRRRGSSSRRLRTVAAIVLAFGWSPTPLLPVQSRVLSLAHRHGDLVR